MSTAEHSADDVCQGPWAIYSEGMLTSYRNHSRKAQFGGSRGGTFPEPRNEFDRAENNQNEFVFFWILSIIVSTFGNLMQIEFGKLFIRATTFATFV